MEVSEESEEYPRRFSELGGEFVMKHCSIEDGFIAVARDADAVTTVGSNLQAREKYIARWGPMREPSCGTISRH